MCRKRKYPNELDALIALANIQASRNQQNRIKTEKSVYKCPKCKTETWHLTSQRKETDA